MQEIRRLTEFANQYEDDFVKTIMGRSMQMLESERAVKQRELEGLLSRDKELDRLFEKIYEDNAAGKLTDERFGRMSRNYEQEQGDIGKRIKALSAELKKDTSLYYTADSFLEVVRRYTEARELTQHMLVELIDYIDVYHAEKVSGLKTQRIVIHYNCIGAFEVPDRETIPELEVYIKTRKGVALCYSNEKVGQK